MEQILVTGASGFVGGHIAEHLLKKGHTVISISHDSKPVTTSKLLGIEDQIIWAKGDILDNNCIKRVISDYEVTQIYHTAALPIVRVGGRTTVPIFETNIMGTVNILEAVREQNTAGYNIDMLFISTDKVYGNSGQEPYKEDIPLKALGIYEASKAAADIICRSYFFNYGINVVVARCCNIIGTADLNSRIVPNTIKRCLSGKNPLVYKDMDYVREYINVNDAISAYELLLDNIKLTKGEIYNIGSGDIFKQEEVIEKILNHFPELEMDYVEAPFYTKTEIPYQKLCIDKIYNQFKWKSKISFDKSIREITYWWSKHMRLFTPKI